MWSVLLYGSEVWTLDKKLKKRIEAVEMWFLRGMLSVPWTARMTNVRVMELAGVGRKLMGRYGGEAATEIPWAPTATQLSGKVSAPWSDRGEACERKTEHEIYSKSAGGHPGRSEGGRPSVAGAGPERAMVAHVEDDMALQ